MLQRVIHVPPTIKGREVLWRLISIFKYFGDEKLNYMPNKRSKGNSFHSVNFYFFFALKENCKGCFKSKNINFHLQGMKSTPNRINQTQVKCKSTTVTSPSWCKRGRWGPPGKGSVQLKVDVPCALEEIK